LRFLRHIERNAVLLFMVPADADDIAREYEILLEELRRFNPQLVDKERVLAISKSDMLDQELIDEITPTLPADIPHVFISAVTGQGLTELKDALWKAITDDANRIQAEPITHRALDEHHRVREEDEFIFEPEKVAADIPDDEEIIYDDGFDPEIDYEWEYGDNEV
ncbi:MAG: GTPase ObgE, partial [Muribaculaceae bacterium]|nr:GTPase ObgE [Muribaculaceae bacterium]